jgi:hypothetical protein
VGIVIPPYKTTNMEMLITVVLILVVTALVYGYNDAQDNEIVIEINRLKIPYFKLGIHIERYVVHSSDTHEDEQHDVFTFSFVFISLQITFFKILEA